MESVLNFMCLRHNLQNENELCNSEYNVSFDNQDKVNQIASKIQEWKVIFFFYKVSVRSMKGVYASQSC